MPKIPRANHQDEFRAIWADAGEPITRDIAASLLGISVDVFDKFKKPSYKPGAPRWAVEIFPAKIAAYYLDVLKSPPPEAIMKRVQKIHLSKR